MIAPGLGRVFLCLFSSRFEPSMFSRWLSLSTRQSNQILLIACGLLIPVLWLLGPQTKTSPIQPRYVWPLNYMHPKLLDVQSIQSVLSTSAVNWRDSTQFAQALSEHPMAYWHGQEPQQSIGKWAVQTSQGLFYFQVAQMDGQWLWRWAQGPWWQPLRADWQVFGLSVSDKPLSKE